MVVAKVVNQLELDDLTVVRALRAVGLNVASVYDLVNSRSAYFKAHPVLLECLPKVKSVRIKEGIVRALTIQGASDAVVRTLIDEFKSLPIEDCTATTDATTENEYYFSYKWAIANALSEIASDSFFEEIRNLAEDRRHGKAREMLVMALGKMKKSPEAGRVAHTLLSDEGMVGYAVDAVGRLKVLEAKGDLKRIASEHPVKWVREEAQKALRKFERLEQRPAKAAAKKGAKSPK